MPTAITVPFAERYESMSGGADEQGQYETRVYNVLWADRAAFMQQMAGGYKQSGGINGGVLVNTPFQCPGNPKLYAQNMAWVPAGTPIIPSDPGEFSHVDITVVYRTPTFGFGPTDAALTFDPSEPLLAYCTGEIDFGREKFSKIGGSKWLSDAKKINAAFGLDVATVNLTLTWNEFPFLPWPILQDYADAVNDEEFLSAPRGTIMLDGPRVSFQRTRAGNQGLRLQVGFKYRSIPWNQSLRDDNSQWDTPVDQSYSSGDSDDFEKYEYKPFRKLLWEDFFES